MAAHVCDRAPTGALYNVRPAARSCQWMELLEEALRPYGMTLEVCPKLHSSSAHSASDVRNSSPPLPQSVPFA